MGSPPLRACWVHLLPADMRAGTQPGLGASVGSHGVVLRKRSSWVDLQETTGQRQVSQLAHLQVSP